MSGDQQEFSIPAQRAELLRYAKQHGYKVLREYLDEAISGDATEQRTGFLAMREDATSGKFTVILAWSQDRVGRFDILDAGHWIYPFRQAGIRLETISEGAIDWEDLTGQLVYSVNQLGKAQFLRDLSRNTTRGLLNSAREGRAGTGGPNPYGYGSKDGKVWIVEDAAKVVKQIFAMYLKPDGALRGIAAELNRRKVPPPRGKVWRCSSVRAILVRRKYTGSFVYGGRNAGKYFSWRDGEIIPRKKSDKAITSDPIVHEGRFEAIVSRKVFDKVQVKLVGRKGNTAPKRSRQYLLSGLCKCGDCAGAMGGHSRSNKAIYSCRTYSQAGLGACYPNRIDEAPLVDCIVRKVQERYLSEPALARLRQALEAKQNQDKPRPRDVVRLRREVEVLNGKIDAGAGRALEAPPDLVPTLYRKLEAWRGDRDRLKSDLDATVSRQARPDVRDGSQVNQAIEALRNLRQAFMDVDPKDARQLIGSLVSRIELHFDHSTTKGGRRRSTFKHGTIYVRPDAGEARASDPNSSHLINKRSLNEIPSGSLLARRAA